MAKLNPTKTAYAVGLFIGTIALIKTLLLAFGGAGLFNWIVGLHFVSGIAFQPVVVSTAITSIVFHLIVGAIIGWLFATVWNKVYK